MFKIIKNSIVAVVAIVLLLSPVQSNASEQITVEGLYRHPLTGNIEDSGGEASEALGQSMVTKMVGEFGSYDSERKTLDIVFGLMNSISNVDIQVQFTGLSEFNSVDFYELERVGEDATFRVPVSNKGDILRVEAFIEPMGRAVKFYVVVAGVLDEQNNAQESAVDTSSMQEVTEDSGVSKPEGLIIGGPDVDSQSTEDEHESESEIQVGQNNLNSNDTSNQTLYIFLLGFSILVTSGVTLIVFAMVLPKMLEDKKALKQLAKERELQKFEREVTTKEEEEFNTEEIIRLLEEGGINEQNKDA